MARVRGSFVLYSLQFVREQHGPKAHDAVLAALPEPERLWFEGRLALVRDSSWEPLEPVAAYMEAARRLLAPGDPDFFRAMGRFAARTTRATTAFAAMVADSSTAVRMIPVLARAFMDVGSVEVLPRGPRELTARLRDYPRLLSVCERRQGAWAVLLGSGDVAALVKEVACICQGDPFCQLEVTLPG